MVNLVSQANISEYFLYFFIVVYAYYMYEIIAFPLNRILLFHNDDKKRKPLVL